MFHLLEHGRVAFFTFLTIFPRTSSAHSVHFYLHLGHADKAAVPASAKDAPARISIAFRGNRRAAAIWCEYSTRKLQRLRWIHSTLRRVFLASADEANEKRKLISSC